MSGRRKILFLTHRLPFPPDKGDKIRTFHQLDHLALSHDVYCACFIDDPADRAYIPTMRKWCTELVCVPWCRSNGLARAIAGLCRRESITRMSYEDRALREAIAAMVRRIDFDAVVAFSACMAPYALEVKARRRVLDLCDADSQKWLELAEYARWPRSAIYRWEGHCLREFEQACLYAFDATLVITDRERKLIDPRQRCATLHVIPNGVHGPVDAEMAPLDAGPVAGFVGAMDYPPNIDGVRWFVREVWPLVKSEYEEAQLRIIGRAPTRSVRRLASTDGVIVTGRVPDVGKELARCRITVAPLRVARGLQNKVLEAMAHAKPVVATSAVADTLNADPGEHFLIADEPESFAEHVVDLFTDLDLCERIGRSGRARVLAEYRWDDALANYERILLGDAPPPVVTARRGPIGVRRKAANVDTTVKQPAGLVSAVVGTRPVR